MLKCIIPFNKITFQIEWRLFRPLLLLSSNRKYAFTQVTKRDIEGKWDSLELLQIASDEFAMKVEHPCLKGKNLDELHIIFNIFAWGKLPPYSELVLRSLTLSVPTYRNFQSNGANWQCLKLWKRLYNMIFWLKFQEYSNDHVLERAILIQKIWKAIFRMKCFNFHISLQVEGVKNIQKSVNMSIQICSRHSDFFLLRFLENLNKIYLLIWTDSNFVSALSLQKIIVSEELFWKSKYGKFRKVK